MSLNFKKYSYFRIWSITTRLVYIQLLRTCALCNVLPDDGLQKRPKRETVVVYKMNLLLCPMGENKNTFNVKYTFDRKLALYEIVTKTTADRTAK